MTKGNALGSRTRAAASQEPRALPREFYDRDTVQVARELLGMTLVRQSRAGLTVGRIVEVEAYLAESDAACHAMRGCTPSNRAMFGPPGRAYVYPIHSRYCLNAVTMPRGVATAVLIRAVEPLVGHALMRRRRGTSDDRQLANGPAKLCEAFDVDRRLDHWDLTSGRRLWIGEPTEHHVPCRRYPDFDADRRHGCPNAAPAVLCPGQSLCQRTSPTLSLQEPVS